MTAREEYTSAERWLKGTAITVGVGFVLLIGALAATQLYAAGLI